MSEYLNNQTNYKKHKAFFRSMMFKYYQFKMNEVDDIYHDIISNLLVSELNNKKWASELHCKNSLNNSLFNKIKMMRKKKFRTPDDDINNYDFEFEDEKESNEQKAKEAYLKEIIEDWMLKNLTHIEQGLFRMWYYNKYTYKEIAEISTFEKTFIFNTIKNVKQKVKEEFKDIEY